MAEETMQNAVTLDMFPALIDNNRYGSGLLGVLWYRQKKQKGKMA